MQRAALHEHGGHRATALVQVRLQGHALGVLVRVSPQVERGVGGQDDRLEQAGEAGPLGGGHVHELRVAAELLGDEPVLGQLGPHPLRVRTLLVDLVDGYHDRHAGRLRMVQRLGGLRLHAVVGRHHEDHEVGGLGAAGAHGGERLVTRGVDEGDLPLVAVDLGGDLVGADVLGDAAGLAGHHVGVADRVEQLGLAVIDMTHHRDHRRPGHQVGVLALVLAELDVEGLQQFPVLFLRGDDLDGVVQLGAEQLQGLVVDRLGRGHHLAQGQQHLDQRRRVGPDLVREIAQAGAPAQPDHLAVAGPDLDAADRRRLHVVELLAPLLLRLPAPGRAPAGTPERTLGTAAPATAARTGRTAAGPGSGARRTARTGRATSTRTRARATAAAATTAARAGACAGSRAAAAAAAAGAATARAGRGRPGRHVHRARPGAAGTRTRETAGPRSAVAATGAARTAGSAGAASGRTRAAVACTRPAGAAVRLAGTTRLTGNGALGPGRRRGAHAGRGRAERVVTRPGAGTRSTRARRTRTRRARAGGTAGAARARRGGPGALTSLSTLYARSTLATLAALSAWTGRARAGRLGTSLAGFRAPEVGRGGGSGRSPRRSRDSRRGAARGPRLARARPGRRRRRHRRK